MIKGVLAGVAAVMVCASFTAAPAPARAAEPTIGIVAAFSGPYAEWGQAYKREIDLWMQQNNGKHGWPKVHVILRDAPGISNIARTKQVVQEFIVRDHVTLAGGDEFTPEAYAVAPLVTQAKMPYVVFNGSTSNIPDKSPYLIRVGFTTWQPDVPIAEYAATHGCKRVTMVVANYAPGIDTINAFSYGFKKKGGTVAAVIKVPMGTEDFSSYLEKIKASHTQCVFPFMPGGPMSLAFIKQYTNMGFKKQGITYYDAGTVAENQLDAIGDDALGIISSGFYSTYLDNPTNKAFIGALQKKYPNIKREFVTTFAYDGMHLMFHMLKATEGHRTGPAMLKAAIGYHWMSPRGPISIDNDRDIVQNIYIRKVVKGKDGKLYNKAFLTYHDVHDQWHEVQAMKKKK